MKKTPTGARPEGLPVSGTLILLMMPDHWPNWPMWVWGSLWTLWVLYWVLIVAAIVTTERIPDDKWNEVFGK